MRQNEDFMSAEGIEKRKYKRVYFPVEYGLVGILRLPGIDTALTASVLDLSEGGVGLSLRKDGSPKIIKGDRLILIQIVGKDHLRFFTDIEAEIKWVMKNEHLKHIGFGCEFLNASIAIKDQIRQFVNLAVKKLEKCSAK
jgi:c-di-GMP-binding flagellar brake protein YcgR